MTRSHITVTLLYTAQSYAGYQCESVSTVTYGADSYPGDDAAKIHALKQAMQCGDFWRDSIEPLEYIKQIAIQEESTI